MKADLKLVHYNDIPLRLSAEEYIELKILARENPQAADAKCREYVERAYGDFNDTLTKRT